MVAVKSVNVEKGEWETGVKPRKKVVGVVLRWVQFDFRAGAKVCAVYTTILILQSLEAVMWFVGQFFRAGMAHSGSMKARLSISSFLHPCDVVLFYCGFHVFMPRRPRWLWFMFSISGQCFYFGKSNYYRKFFVPLTGSQSAVDRSFSVNKKEAEYLRSIKFQKNLMKGGFNFWLLYFCLLPTMGLLWLPPYTLGRWQGWMTSP